MRRAWIGGTMEVLEVIPRGKPSWEGGDEHVDRREQGRGASRARRALEP
jgi:hypothetical protein